MRARFLFKPVFIALALPIGLCAQVVTYTFGPTGTPTAAATTTAVSASASSFASFTGGGTTSSTSPGSTSAGGGGGSYFIASNWRSSDGNYFYFTLTPDSGYAITLTGLSFYYASSSTGPSSATLASSADNYASTLGAFTLTQQAGGSLLASDWRSANSSITLSALSSATTFRLNATGATSAGGTFRVDAVTLNGSISAVPEPSTYAAILGALALAVGIWRRQRGRPAGKD